MSRSSSSRERAGTEPVVALAAVLALSLGLSAYTVVLDGVGTGGSAPEAGPTLERIADAVTVGGVAAPARLADAAAAGRPDGYRVNATLTAAGRTWAVGGSPPRTGGDRSAASRRLGVELAPGRVRPGTLAVRVWR